ncbi:Alpha/Beta hydrolase protein [Podospora didyma]|uniref:feruloyl esterase n=1 Tax=Podospora didyma TaxID=330526 RepID=A0AAE0NQR0_9PEZI|nr:Alpha/Beta hydrolase protein [Podospora didyma]
MSCLLSKLGTATVLIIRTQAVLAAGKPSPGCGSAPKLISSASTSTPLKLTVSSKSREFFVKLPDNYNASHPYRLVLTLHALGGTAQAVIAGTGGYIPWYGLPPLANDTLGAIFIAPNGLSNGWANTNGDDVAFIRQAIATVEADVCVDQTLRFSTGFSYGGAMSYALACALGSDIRAVAALSGNPQISGCASPASDAVAYYGQHGVSDTVLPIAGGREMRDRFVKNNGCAVGTSTGVQEPAAGSGKHTKTVYTGCKADKPVVWVAFDGPHTPTPKDGGASDTWVPAETWAFFAQFT